jgi:hypothetical protein
LATRGRQDAKNHWLAPAGVGTISEMAGLDSSSAEGDNEKMAAGGRFFVLLQRIFGFFLHPMKLFRPDPRRT